MVLVEPPKGVGAPTPATAHQPSQVVRPRDAQHHAPPQDALGIADTVPDAFSDLDELLADVHEPRASESDQSGMTEPAADMDENVTAESATAMSQVARWSPATIVVGAGIVGVVLAVSASLLLILGFGRNASQVTTALPGDSTAPGSETPSDEDVRQVPSIQDGPDTPDGSTDDPAPPPTKPDSPTPADGSGDASRTPEENRKPDQDNAPANSPKPTAKPKDGAKDPATPDDANPDFQPKPSEIRRPLPALGGKFADVLNNAPIELGPRMDDSDEPRPPDNPSDVSVEPGAKPDGPPRGRIALPRPLAREVDLPARLADPLASVSYQAVPLLDFVYEVSDLSTIPITIDLNVLRLRQLSVVVPITAKLESSTVEQLLVAALEPHNLVAAADADSQLIVTLPRDEGLNRKANYAIEDLTGGEGARVESLIGLLTSFAAPDSWTVAGGMATIEAASGQLTIEGPEITHLETMFLLEKVRAAQKLKPVAKPPFAPSLIEPDSVRARAAEKLALPLKLNFGRPTRLTSILQRLSRDTGTRIVPNWQSLAAIGWTTETQATVTVEGKSLDETLVALLEPMELTYRVVDDLTIEVVTSQSAAAILDVEFHSVADLVQVDADALIQRIEAELGSERFATNGGTALVRFDAPTKCLVVAAPYALQRRLSQTLSAWRAEAAK